MNNNEKAEKVTERIDDANESLSFKDFCELQINQIKLLLKNINYSKLLII